MGQLLARGCTVFSAESYLFSISSFQPFRERLIFFHASVPLPDPVEKMLNDVTGCIGILYLINNTYPSIQKQIDRLADLRPDKTLIEHHGAALLVLRLEPPAALR